MISLPFENIDKFISRGIEREGLRVDDNGAMQMDIHPDELGSKLCHKSITTDYSENLLEFITVPHDNIKSLSKELNGVIGYFHKELKNQYLWPMSMPCKLPDDHWDIPIANYGESNTGKLKTIYRRGLAYRYGKSMQVIAGVHFNFSFSDDFWRELCRFEKSSLKLKQYKNEKYFHMIKNFKRYEWVLIYLFGASPFVLNDFLKDKKHNLEKINEEMYGLPYGTSLRMGGLGYTSNAQEKINLCFNSVESYIETLENARLESQKKYEEIGEFQKSERIQLNTNLLQIDNEYYSTIRPKNVAKPGESALGAIHERGVNYIEIRLLDVDPFSPSGINDDTIHFLDCFLTFCLLNDSPHFCEKECEVSLNNFQKVLKEGRKKNLVVQNLDGEDILFEDYKNETLLRIQSVSSYFDKASQSKINNVISNGIQGNILSARVQESLTSYDKILNLMADQKRVLRKLVPDDIQLDLDIEAKDSIKRQLALETSQSGQDFEDFLAGYFTEIKIDLKESK